VVTLPKSRLAPINDNVPDGVCWTEEDLLLNPWHPIILARHRRTTQSLLALLRFAPVHEKHLFIGRSQKRQCTVFRCAPVVPTESEPWNKIRTGFEGPYPFRRKATTR